MAYNLDAIRKKIGKLENPGGGVKKTDRPKFNWFKPELGETNIRFLPYQDPRTGEPFQTVSYYDTRLLSERRIVAPVTFGLEDPIAETLTELRKERQDKDTWNFMRQLEAKDKYYAPILVRGQEDKGVQIWEMSKTLVKDVYNVLMHPDYADDDVMSPETGLDWILSVTKSDRTWQGRPVKDYKITPRRKASKLSTKKSEAAELVESVPDLESYFKAIVMSADKLRDLFNAAMSDKGELEESDDDEDYSHNEHVTNEVSDDEETTEEELEAAFQGL